MIRPDMNIGDRFEDGGLCYEVQTVLPDGNYISRRVEDAGDTPAEDKRRRKKA